MMTITPTKETHKPHEPWHQPWPADTLESVICCPICAGKERKKLYENLTDRVYRVAPGKWTMYQCSNCRSSYLDPRPTETSIGLAYKTYYTHNINADERNSGHFNTLRKIFINSYLNDRYKTRYQPSAWLAARLVRMLFIQREQLDARYRWMKLPFKGARLLDVGFGSGQFLKNAIDMGWEVTGVDPDPVAVTNARKRGLNVYSGGIAVIDPQKMQFEAITINHVIEHVHNPEDVIKKAFELLTPNGVLYVDTPNIESFGHHKFKGNWMPLDAPRHLVVFSKNAMFELLSKAGFNDIEFISRYNVSTHSYTTSMHIKAGREFHQNSSIWLKIQSWIFYLKARIGKSGLEYISLQAKKG